MEDLLSKYSYKIEFKSIIYSTIVIFIISALLLLNAPQKLIFIAGFAALPLICLVSLNFYLITSILITSFYFNFYIGGIAVSVYISVFVFLSAVFLYHDISFKKFNNIVFKGFIVYILCILPSYLNSTDLYMSLKKSSNLFMMFSIVVSAHFVKLEKNHLYNLLKLFLILLTIAGLALIVETLLIDSRSFGFTGVILVDYLGLGITLVLTSILLETHKNFNIFFLIILLVITIFTQTRNIFLPITASFLAITAFLYLNSNSFNLSKRRLFIIMASFLVGIITIFLAVHFLFPEITERYWQLTEMTKHTFDNAGRIQNSLLTRLMIWHTAYNGFIENPIIGVGAYSFSFMSAHYYTIPKYLYELYVQGLSVHHGYFAVLTETGILGMVGFISFLVLLVRFSIKNIKNSLSTEVKRISIVGFASILYVIFALFVTDAWLWGHGGILFAIIIGVNIIIKNNFISDNE